MYKRYREYALALPMLAGCGLLAVVLLWQWLHYRHLKAEVRSRMAAKVEVHLPAPAGEDKPYQLPGLDKYAATVDSPLFMETRKPAEADAEAPADTNAPKSPLAVKLMGVVFGPGEAVGLFVDAQGKYKRLHKNDSISGWKVAELAVDKAVMEQDDDRQELKLLKPKPKKPALPPAPAPGAPPPLANPFAGQPPPQPMDANRPGFPQGAAETEPPNPNEPIDEIPVQPEEIPNDQ